MVEVVVLLGSDLDGVSGLGQVLAIHAHDVDTTIFLAWHQESIGHNNCSLSKHVLGNDLDVVGPLELGGVELDWFELGDGAINDCILDAWDHVDMA